LPVKGLIDKKENRDGWLYLKTRSSWHNS
jgi:hypothetical protein